MFQYLFTLRRKILLIIRLKRGFSIGANSPALVVKLELLLPRGGRDYFDNSILDLKRKVALIVLAVASVYVVSPPRILEHSRSSARDILDNSMYLHVTRVVYIVCEAFQLSLLRLHYTVSSPMI